MKPTRVLLVFCGALTLIACDTEEKKDAARIVDAVRRFRTAETADMPPLVAALKETPCKTDETCKVKDDCLKTGEATSKAIQIKTEAELALAAIEQGKLDKESPEAISLPAKLDQASALLKIGKDATTACDEGVTALKRKYSLY